jgi:glycosyltransferase involved in cell wall biosynthesis
MNEQHPYRATIPPVPERVSRPLWSVMIPTYNCANYLREALASVLVQDPGSEVMQIEVIDDCSTQDNPAEMVEELGRGRVSFFQQSRNVGHIKNFQTCLERSQGKLIHLLHGDDCVLDGFYRKLQRGFDEKPEIGAAFCRHIFMDELGHWQAISWLEQPETGILKDWLERIAVEQRIQTPSIVVRREVYEKLGTFDSRLSWTEDWEMWVRIAAHYNFWYEVEPLALYRIHSNSSSERHISTGENIRDLHRAIRIFQSYLPPATAGGLVNKAKENWALEVIRQVTPEMLARGNLNAATLQIREVTKLSLSLEVIKELFPLLLQIGKRWIVTTLKNALHRPTC